MKIGIPKEVKPDESRVALTPGGVLEVLKSGDHEITIETGAGLGSGFTDDMYVEQGAKILPDAPSVYRQSELVVKVKEPVESEWPLIEERHTLFTYFHFASNESLTGAMLKSGCVCVAYETVRLSDGSLPLLIPMSEVAGRMAVQQGAKYLEKPVKGRGILLGGVPGVPPGRVLILGGGVVGKQAAKMAAGLGARVTIMDVSLPVLRHINDIMPAHVTTVFSHEHNIRKNLKNHDLIIGAVLLPGAKAPRLVTEDMLSDMRPGTVMVDVAIDQGGCFATSRPTTHENPTYIVNDVVHYCVTNMPGAVPYTSTVALTNATLPYVIELARHGWRQSVARREDLREGLNMAEGVLYHRGVAEAFGLNWQDSGTVVRRMELK